MFLALGAATLLLSAIAPPLHDDKATLSSGEATLFASSALPTLALVNREQASRCWQSCSAVSLSGLAPGFESLEGPFFYVGSLHERPVYSTTQGAIAPATGTFFLSWFADERYAHSGGFWKIGPDYGTDGYLLGALSESTCPPAKWTAGNAASGGTTMSCRDVSPSLSLPTAEEARPRLLQEAGAAGAGAGAGAGVDSAGAGADARADTLAAPPAAPPAAPAATPEEDQGGADSEGRKLQIEEPCSNECDYPNDEVCDDEVCDVGELVGKLVDGTADWSSYGALVVAITGLFALLAVGPPVVTLMKRKRQQQLANAERRRRAVVLQQQRAVQAARAAQSNAARRLTVQTKIDTLTRERDVLKGRIAWLQVQMEDESTMDESAPILRIAEENLKGVEQSLARAKAELAAIPP